MQIEGGRPLGVVFLVYGYVIVAASEESFGGCLDLHPCVIGDNRVFAEFWLADHDIQLVIACTAFHGNFDEQVMVAVPDEGNFDVVSLQFLCDFFAVIDVVLEVTAAFDFPTVVDAAASGQASNDTRDEKSRCELCENC